MQTASIDKQLHEKAKTSDAVLEKLKSELHGELGLASYLHNAELVSSLKICMTTNIPRSTNNKCISTEYLYSQFISMKKNANCIRIAIITNAVRPKRTLVIFFSFCVDFFIFNTSCTITLYLTNCSD